MEASANNFSRMLLEIFGLYGATFQMETKKVSVEDKFVLRIIIKYLSISLPHRRKKFRLLKHLVQSPFLQFHSFLAGSLK